ncbi:MAG: Uma2 family endonuclease [Calothrix sp. FI2-JRJ7]|jgi:Uma2 family endonuclease|nr:Uma2 family endonuclease [Calothrix sp. FI2-JRJ7]
MLSDHLKAFALPSTEDLPCSDDTPVDNEDQNYLPNVLLFLLKSIWKEREDWFFGVDMAVYHTTGTDSDIPVVPDGFLSLGVERKKGGKSRRSYATWEENGVAPIFVLEMVSHKAGGEYDKKLKLYAKLGVLYYLIYNPEYSKRDKHQPFEVYKLLDKSYKLQSGEPYWMPEVGLGVGRHQMTVNGISEEFLFWYDEQGERYLTGDETTIIERQRADREKQRADREERRADEERRMREQETLRANEERRMREQETLRADQERQKNEQLIQYLRSLGIDPNNLPPN